MGCTPAVVRDLIHSGRLSATRVGNQWFIDAGELSRPGPASGPVGRQLSQRLCWALLGQLEGREISSTLHREERARLQRYLNQPEERLWRRLRNRAVERKLSVSSATAERLCSDRRWVEGGEAAAAHYLGQQRPYGVVTFYARASSEEEFYDTSLAVPDEQAPNVLLKLIEDRYWPFDIEMDRYVFGTVALLDCLEQAVRGIEAMNLWPPAPGILASGRRQHMFTPTKGAAT